MEVRPSSSFPRGRWKTLARARARALAHTHTHTRSLELARSLSRARIFDRALSHLEREREGERVERMEKAASLDRSSVDAC